MLHPEAVIPSLSFVTDPRKFLRLREENEEVISLMENRAVGVELLTDSSDLRRQVELAVATVPVIDIHTHIFPTEFDEMCFHGIDDLLTYHYLIAETFRSTDISHACFWEMTKTERADLIWQSLFVESTPLSEAARGIISV